MFFLYQKPKWQIGRLQCLLVRPSTWRLGLIHLCATEDLTFPYLSVYCVHYISCWMFIFAFLHVYCIDSLILIHIWTFQICKSFILYKKCLMTLGWFDYHSCHILNMSFRLLCCFSINFYNMSHIIYVLASCFLGVDKFNV